MANLLLITEILFNKYDHRLHTLKITFQNRTKVRITHFNVSVSVNAAEITKECYISFMLFD